MTTTIKVSQDVKSSLDNMRLFERESYNEVLARIIEDTLELNTQTKREIEEARVRVAAGEFVSMDDVAKRFL